MFWFGASPVSVREPHRAGAIASLVIAYTYLYSEFSAAIWQIAVVTLGFTATAALVYRSRSNWSRATTFLNVVSILLLIGSAVTIVPYEIDRAGRNAQTLAERDAIAPVPEPGAVAGTPSIYYVILDGYGRDDILHRYYDHDNRYFTDFLREHGFYVAERARSNYARTIHSVVSTLYATHLANFIEEHRLDDSRDIHRLVDILAYSSVFRFLERHGYATHAYSSTNVAYPAGEVVLPQAPFSYFEREVSERTPFAPLLDTFWELNAYRIHHDVIRDTIARLNSSVTLPGPKFVLAHIVCPHPPFVFDREGNFRDEDGDHRLTDGDVMVGRYMTEEQYRRLYSDQVHWLNGEVMSWVRRVRETDPTAVIVLQGDHGPGSMFKWNSLEGTNMIERFSILNALCMPGADSAVFYPSLSNVNTFRLIFNAYFGTEFALEPDSSFFSEASRPMLLYQIHFPDSVPQQPTGETAEP